MNTNPEIATDAIDNIAQQMSEAKRSEISRLLLALNSSSNDENHVSDDTTGVKPSRTVSLPNTMYNYSNEDKP